MAAVPSRPGLSRRPVVALAAGAAVLAALALVFGVLVQPDDEGSCTSGLYPGTYRDLFVPLHLVAFVVLAGLVARATRHRALVAIPVGVLALCLAWEQAAVLLGIAALLAAWPAALAAVLIVAVPLVRGRGGPSAGTVELLLWMMLCIGFPAAMAGAYVNGAGLFCF